MCAGREFLARNSNHYDLVKTEVVSVQTNSALFVADDKDCEDLAHKLIAASRIARCNQPGRLCAGNSCCRP
jgi:hypothetical protein